MCCSVFNPRRERRDRVGHNVSGCSNDNINIIFINCPRLLQEEPCLFHSTNNPLLLMPQFNPVIVVWYGMLCVVEGRYHQMPQQMVTTRIEILSNVALYFLASLPLPYALDGM